MLFVLVASVATAQQNTIDSLRTELNKHSIRDTGWLSIANKLSFAYRSIDPLKGVALADTNIALAHKLNDSSLLAGAYLVKAGNYIIIGMYDSALYLYNNALPIYQRIKNLNGLGSVEADLGIIYFYKSDYLKSIYHQKEADIIFKYLHDDLKLALNYTNFGLSYEGISDFNNALQYHLKAMRIYQKYNIPVSLASTYGNLSEVYRGLNNYTQALEYAQKSLDISKQAGNSLIISDSYALIGQAYFYMNQPQKAIDNFLQGLAIAAKYDFKNAQSVILQLTGSCYNVLKDHDSALYYLDKSIDLLTMLGDEVNLSASYDELAKVYLDCPESFLKKQSINPSNRYALVLKYQYKSLAIAKEIGALEKEENVWSDISNTYKKQGNYTKAYGALQQSIIFKDSVLNDSKKQQATRLEMQYQFDTQEDSVKAVNDKKQLMAAAKIKQQQTIRNAVIAGAIILSVSGFFVFIAYKKRMDSRAKQHDAEMQMQVIDTEMKALRAQMNPHFIFNSLNSINDYIYRNDAATATTFTTRFASLMRRILENSEHKKIQLDNELETVELYLQLETLRLQRKFSYEIIIDENIDKSNTLIPPSLLQPFLENSILHGFAGKQADGKIILQIQQEEDMLKCSIRDNGSGIKPSTVNNSLIEKKSMGLSITKSRIDIINRLRQSNGTIEIKNIEDGTLAEITIPFETKF